MEEIKVGANGVLIDQGSQALRVGTGGITLITNNTERARLDNNGMLLLNDGLSFYVGADNQNSLRLHHINNDCYVDYGVGNLSFRHSTATSIDLTAMQLLANGQIVLGGDIGIGTTNPQTKLHVSGFTGYSTPGLIAKFRSNISQSGNKDVGMDFYINNGDATGGSHDGSYTAIQSLMDNVQYTPLILNPLAGSVGIGTTNPLAKLHIQNTGLGDFLTLFNSTRSYGQYMNLRFAFGNSTTSKNAYIQIYQFSDDDASIRFYTQGASASAINPMVIRGNGNVGVGTDDPQATLHVGGNGAKFIGYKGEMYSTDAFTGQTLPNWLFEISPLGNSWNGDGNKICQASSILLKAEPLKWAGGSVNIPGAEVIIEGGKSNRGANTGASIIFKTYDAERMRITPWGNVGIGTTNARCKFDVMGFGNGNTTDYWIAGAFGAASTSTAPRVVMGTYSNTAIIGGHNSTLSDWANLCLNTGGGNVGIGTTNPGVKLEVAGNFQASGVHRSYNTSFWYDAANIYWNPGDPVNWPWAGSVFYITFRGSFPNGGNCVRGHFLVFHSRWNAGNNGGVSARAIHNDWVNLAAISDGGMSFVFNSPAAQTVDINILVVG